MARGSSSLVGELPGVTSYTYTVEDIDGEGTTRTEDGEMHRELVRGGVIHASVEHIVTKAELETISSTIKADTTIEIALYTPGASSKNNKYYCSKYNAELIRLWDPQTAAVDDWWRVTYDLIEV